MRCPYNILCGTQSVCSSYYIGPKIQSRKILSRPKTFSVSSSIHRRVISSSILTMTSFSYCRKESAKKIYCKKEIKLLPEHKFIGLEI